MPVAQTPIVVRTFHQVRYLGFEADSERARVHRHVNRLLSLPLRWKNLSNAVIRSEVASKDLNLDCSDDLRKQESLHDPHFHLLVVQNSVNHARGGFFQKD